MPFFFWPWLGEVCALLFGSGAPLQYKQLTSSSWPLWTEPAASHEHTGAGRAQCLLSLPGPRRSQPGRSWASRHRKHISTWPKDKPNFPTFFMTPRLFSTSWDINRSWKILFFAFFVPLSSFFLSPRMHLFLCALSLWSERAAWFVRLFKRALVEARFSLFLQDGVHPLNLYSRLMCVRLH